MTTRTVAVNELGYRIGEDHPRAVLTNGEAELLLTMHGEGLGYLTLARKFEISKSQARNIVKGTRRCQSIAGWKVIPTEKSDEEAPQG